MTCTGVQTVAGRVQVRWESKSASTPMGQLANFIEFINLTGLWQRWLESCPLTYLSHNSPSKADVLGTWMLSYQHGSTSRTCGSIGATGTARYSSEVEAQAILRSAPQAGRTLGWRANEENILSPPSAEEPPSADNHRAGYTPCTPD